GKYLSGLLCTLTGKIVTGLVLLLLAVIWGVCASPSFSLWIERVFTKRPDARSEEAEVPSARGSRIAEPEQNAGPDLFEEPEPIEAPMTADIPEPVRPAATKPEPVPEPEPQASGEDTSSGSVEVVEGPDLGVSPTELPRIDTRDEPRNYKFPPIDLLKDYKSSIHDVPQSEIESNNTKIRTTLASFRIRVDSVSAVKGPTVTLYKVKLAQGATAASVKNREVDIAMSLGVKGVRVTILEDSVGIEVPNAVASTVPLRAVLADEKYASGKMELPIALGYTLTQSVKTFDLSSAPHLLVAGATQQGKSVGLNVIITSLLYAKHPSELKFVFVDPKMVEFQEYRKLAKHYIATIPANSEEEENDNIVVTDAKRAEETLRSLLVEMDSRYNLMKEARVNKLTEYNEKYKNRYLRPDLGHRYLPYLVVIVDEYADLILSPGLGPEAKAVARSITTSIVRLAAKGRACGIHMIIATQRPSVDIITGPIKSNFPVKIAFRVSSLMDSRIIIDAPGAEKLIGRGDLLFSTGVECERAQCAFVSMDEIAAITKFIGSQTGFREHYSTPYYLPEPPKETEESSGSGASSFDKGKLDPLFEEAARMVVTTQKGSTSDLQRQMGVGYARAGRIMDQLEGAKVVGPQVGSKPREVLVKDTFDLDNLLSELENQA
ncbi:MAG: DNA translocase FtsK, partial [Bacteroidales bacterium]|nr:DNA translocase FtsK [Bacteroidales bacterium]